MRRSGRRAAGAALVALAMLVLGAGPAAAASDEPDLSAFSACVTAHSTLAQVRRGSTPRLAQLQLIVATVAASRTSGAKKVAKPLRRAKTAAAVEAALVGLTTWCDAHGVPAITLPTTVPPG